MNTMNTFFLPFSPAFLQLHKGVTKSKRGAVASNRTKAGSFARQRQRISVMLLLLSGFFISVFDAGTQFYYNETCRNATGAFQLYGGAVYTGNGVTDPIGNGWLRLNAAYRGDYKSTWIR
jgi:hypothetical protein